MTMIGKNKNNANTTIEKDAALLESIDPSSTMDLHRSNLLRMQVTELLDECKLDLRTRKWATTTAQEYLQVLTKHISNVSFGTTNTAGASTSTVRDTKMKKGKNQQQKQHSYQEQSDKPISIEQEHDMKLSLEPIGFTKTPVGWTRKSGNAQVLPTFELLVVIPTKVFATKDYLNYRYFDKRNYISDKIVQHLVEQQSNQIGTVQYVWSKGMNRPPYVQLIPPPTKSSNKSSSSTSTKFQVHLHIGMKSIDWIPKLRLVPNRCNNTKECYGTSGGGTGTGAGAATGDVAKSQYYNHTLLYDARHQFQDEHLYDIADHENIESALILIQVWALQRGLWRNHDGWSKEAVGLLLIYLLRTNKVNPRMTPIQLFTVVLKTWAETNWLGTHHGIGDDDDDDDHGHGHGTSRSSHSEAYTTTGATNSSNQYRTVLVLPSIKKSNSSSSTRKANNGKKLTSNEIETIQNSELSKLYYQQTRDSPVTKSDPITLLDAYASIKSYVLGPVFLDPSMTYNYLGEVSYNYMKLLQLHAKKSLQTLDGNRSNAVLASNSSSTTSSTSTFSRLFMSSNRFWNQWDMYIQIPVSMKKKKRNGTIREYEFSSRRLVRTLERSLGNRIYGFRILSTGNGDTTTTTTSSSSRTTSSSIISESPVNINADNFVIETITKKHTFGTYRRKKSPQQSPTGTDRVIIGIAVNPETSQRIVDRGPPSDDTHTKEVKSFLKLWGDKAQLRRFKDGAIVHAVVWNDESPSTSEDGTTTSITFQNESRFNGGCIKKIIQHIVRLHYTSDPIQFSLPNLLSAVDGVASSTNTATAKNDSTQVPFIDPFAAHQNLIKTFDSLSDFLRKNSKKPLGGNDLSTSPLGLPLSIDAVEPLSPSLRYSELFPPVPHPYLGGPSITGKNNKVAGALVSDPVLIQIRFGPSSKWPMDLKAIGAAKTAMLIQLAKGIESSRQGGFDGPVLVTPEYLDVGYKGYCFRILIRADPELRMLRSLVQPSPVAVEINKQLTRKHVLAAKHHSIIHAVHTLHPSAGTVVRMAKRWVDSHLLSGLISQEAIELMVAKIYTESETLNLHPPGTVMSGFLNFLRLLSTHDWARDPLVVNPRGHIQSDDYDDIQTQFELIRGEHRNAGPPMYIIAPYDKNEDADDGDVEDSLTGTGGMSRTGTNINNKTKKNSKSWQPSLASPEWVVVTRACALAKRSYDFMMQCLYNFEDVNNNNDDDDDALAKINDNWSAVFHETANAFKAYSILFRIHPDFVVDKNSSSSNGKFGISKQRVQQQMDSVGVYESSYTQSLKSRFMGPRILQRKLYRNFRNEMNKSGSDGGTVLITSWHPVRSIVETLRKKFHAYALFFYNDSAPDVIGLLWRPQTFVPISFSVMSLEYARPIIRPGTTNNNVDDVHDDDDENNWKHDTLVMKNVYDMLREMSHYYNDVVTSIKIFDESCLLHPTPVQEVSSSQKANKKRKLVKETTTQKQQQQQQRTTKHQMEENDDNSGSSSDDEADREEDDEEVEDDDGSDEEEDGDDDSGEEEDDEDDEEDDDDDSNEDDDEDTNDADED